MQTEAKNDHQADSDTVTEAAASKRPWSAPIVSIVPVTRTAGGSFGAADGGIFT